MAESPENLRDLMDDEKNVGSFDVNVPDRNSLSQDEVEQKLNDLIDSYKQSLKGVSKPDELSSSNEFSRPYLSNHDVYSFMYDTKDSPTIDRLTLRNQVSQSAAMHLNQDQSFLPPSLNDQISKEPFSSLDILTTPLSSVIPSSISFHSPSPIKFNETSLEIPYLYDFEKGSNISPLMGDYKNPSVINDQLTYGNSYSILPSYDPIKLQIDETVTFKKMLNTGISSQLSKQISFLLYESNRLRETNEKLRDEVTLLKSELSSANNKITLLQGQAKAEPERNDNFSGFVEEIYRAQKLRDIAMMERLKETNQARHFALALANQRVAGDEGDIVTSLVRSQSLDDLKDSTSKFLQAIADEKEMRRTTNEEEIEAILFEKDLIYKQKRDLEKENKLLSDQLKSEKDFKDKLRNKLFETDRERNQLLNDINFLQNKLKNLKTYQSLYKSLSKEEELHQQFSNKLSQLSTELENKTKQTKMLKMEVEKFKPILEQLNRDNRLLVSKCSSLEEQLKAEKEQVERLNRLVEVLRRKLKEGSLNMQF